MLPFIRCRHALLAVVLVALVGAASSAYAQSQDSNDPPGRVGRLNYLSGQVSFRPASLDDWGAATINYPLTTGDHLWTEGGSAAEIHVGSTVLRLAQETAFAFLNLDDYTMQVRVAEGTLDLRVREMLEGDAYEVDTPNTAITIRQPGIYRIEVNGDGDRTRLIVREGEAEMAADGRTLPVFAGQMGAIIGTENVGTVIGRAPAPDSWELWCRSRDRREDNRVALNYVSRDMTGYEDLDDYGTWSYEPDYGYAWTPTVVSVGWAPYRYGQWSYMRRWGWTWVDHSPWGYAPFHYGRWAFRHNRWMWCPGQRVVRPLWAPALVAFVGGRNWSYEFSYGIRPAVGWFPLGPGDIYCPSYRASSVYIRRVNVTNVNITRVNITNVNVANLRYANRDVDGAMTAVPRDVFVAAQPIQRAGVAVPRMQAGRTAVVAHTATATPGAMSAIGRVPGAAARPADSVMRRPVMARIDPPADGTRTAPVVSLSHRPRPANADARTHVADDARSGDRSDQRNADSASARPRPNDNRDETPPANNAGGRRDAIADRPPATTPDSYYVTPRAQQPPDSSQPNGAAARPRNVERPNEWRPPTAGGSADAPSSRTPQNDRGSESTYAPRGERSAPREEPPSQNIERARPREDRPSPNYERSTPREDRPSQDTARPRPRDDREERQAPSAARPSGSSEPAARPRGDDRPASPARTERTEAPKSENRGGGAAAPSSARPADKPAERPQPQSGSGRGGNSSDAGSARPRGGRGGV